MTEKTPVRVRFAPSPTGPMHIGGLRTALFNWLFARHHDGTFILRIEDTDQARYDAEAESYIYNALDWIGLTPDEGPRSEGDAGPYRQSERTELYQKWAHWLVENDKAYYDYTTPDELVQLNEARKKQGLPPGYDRRHRDISEEERERLKAEGRPEVIRFKMPLAGKTRFTDMVRGNIEFENNTLSDLVLLKSDGYPTYHLANVVDDHFMEISHIMRANEWIATAPVHKQLYEAFGWEMPEIAHLPLMLNPNGKGKMSKRNPPTDKDGNVIPVLVTDYQKAGYLPEAMFNFLANIGWTFGDERDVFSVEEAIERFDGSHISASNGAYPYEKLKWFNGVYLREKLSADELAERLKPILEDAGLPVDEEKLKIITPAIQTRIETLNDFIGIAGFLFEDDFEPASADDHIQRKMDAEKTKHVLELSHDMLKDADFDTIEELEQPMRDLAKDNGYKFGQLAGTLRTSTTAQRVAPPLFDTFKAIGKEDTLKRIQQSIAIMDAAIADES